MKKNEKIINEDSIVTKVDTLKTFPEDGFVSKEVIQSIDLEPYEKYHKGYSTRKTYTTNDPRITRHFVYGVFSIFFIIGIILLLIKSLLFGIFFTTITIILFFKTKRDIDKVENELKIQGKKVNFDSKEEKKEFYKNYRKELEQGFEYLKKNTFTKNNFKWFVKVSLPVYIIISLIISIICFFINLVLGFLVLLALIIGGGIYYLLISKICKY